MDIDPYKFILILLNIIFPLVIVFYLYYTRKFRNHKEILYASMILVFWALRYCWILIVAFDIQIDLFNRLVALDISLLLITLVNWINSAFYVSKETRWGKINTILSRIVLAGMMLILLPLSIFLPSDLYSVPVRNDINFHLSVILAIFILIIILLALIRVLPSIYQRKTYRYK